MSSTDVRESDLGPLQRLGSGNFGTVHAAPSMQLPEFPGPIAFKRYARLPLSSDRVAALREAVRWRQSLDPGRRHRLDELSAWPLRVVVDRSKRVCGVLMARVVDRAFLYRFVPSAAGAAPYDELLTLGALMQPAATWQATVPGIPDDDDVASRVLYAALLAQFITMLHRHGFLYGDLSGSNVLIGAGASPAIRMIDCDAARPLSAPGGGDQGGTLSWSSPEESTGAPLSAQTDVYKLALAVIRIVAHGASNAQFKDPDRVRAALGDQSVEILRACLAKNPAARPPAGDLYDHLVGILDRLLTPPTITGIEVEPRVLVEGGKVRVTVGTLDADSIEVVDNDGRITPLPGGVGEVPISSTGLLTVQATNRHRTVAANAPLVTVIPMPQLTSLVVPEPVVSGLDVADFSVLRRGLEAAYLSGAGLTTPLDRIDRLRAESAAFDGLLGVLTDVRTTIAPPPGLPDLLTALNPYPRRTT